MFKTRAGVARDHYGRRSVLFIRACEICMLRTERSRDKPTLVCHAFPAMKLPASKIVSSAALDTAYASATVDGVLWVCEVTRRPSGRLAFQVRADGLSATIFPPEVLSIITVACRLADQRL